MTTLISSLQDIYAPIAEDLEKFHKLLQEELSSSDALIQEIHSHLLKTSGKYLRPALALLTSHLGPKSSDRAIPLAVAIELIHTATLVHDDIIDDSELRRDQPSVYSKWGREISIVSGDYLYAKAFRLLASLQSPWLNEAFALCAHTMCEGEMKQIEKRNDFSLNEEECLRIIHQKTAALFQAACTGGVLVAGGGRAAAEHLGQYGLCLGMAFQIVDDCLDLDQSDITLPLVYLFQDLGEAEKQSLSLSPHNGRQDLLLKIQRLVREKKSLEKAMGRARHYANQAVQALGAFQDSAFKESLVNLTRHCLLING